MLPKISIVIPTRNRERFLTQALDSCLRQSVRDLELIVVDDASTDGTESLVRGLGDPRVIYVRQEVRQGSVACLNRGFAMSRGDYLTWTSDDDYYSSTDALSILGAVLDNEPAVGFVYSYYNMVAEDGKFICAARVEKPQGLDRDNYVGHCFLYRRTVYESIGEYSPVYFLTEEYEYWLRIREKFRMKLVAHNLYCHRLHAASLTMSHKTEQAQDMVARARKRFIPLWKHSFFLAESRYHSGFRLRSFGNAVCSLFLNPFNKAGWRLFFLLVLPKAVVRYVRNIRLHSK